MSGPALRAIGEVAAELGVAAHVLRFWESRFPVITPIRRAGGRRYYRAHDVALLRAVARLTRERGMTLAGINTMLREIGPTELATRHGAVVARDGTNMQVVTAAAPPDCVPATVLAAAADSLRTAVAAYRQA